MTNMNKYQLEAITQGEIEAKIAQAHRMRSEAIANGFSALVRAFSTLLRPGIADAKRPVAKGRARHAHPA